jgi:acyl transferase domain-containing protein
VCDNSFEKEYTGNKGLKDYTPDDGDLEGRSEIIVLSGKTPEALKATALNLIKYLTNNTESAPLAHLAYTLACHRTHHQYRLAVIASTKKELIDRLSAFAVEEESIITQDVPVLPTPTPGMTPTLSSSSTLNPQGSSFNTFVSSTSDKRKRIVVVFSGQGPQLVILLLFILFYLIFFFFFFFFLN